MGTQRKHFDSDNTKIVRIKFRKPKTNRFSLIPRKYKVNFKIVNHDI